MDQQQWNKLNEVFHEACALEVCERDEFLDRACSTDTQLRTEVEKLLQHVDTSDDQRLMGPSNGNVHQLLDLGQHDDPMLGCRLGPYEIKERIGRGGFGAVYLATRVEGFDQQVAVKVLREDQAEFKAVLRRFEVERQILADLNHENIARLLDGGSTDRGRPYLVMEFVAGRPITEYCDAEGLPLRDRLELFQRVCHAVAYAHQYGVVHRDIKPGNVLVTDQGQPKLVDFGIAKLIDVPGERRAPNLTRTGQWLLTPDYASPEQVRGEPVGLASDVYSLGVVLYELLTGYRPYTVPTSPPHEIERVVCREIPGRPSSKLRTRRHAETASSKPASNKENLKTVSRNRSTEPVLHRRMLLGDLDNIVLMALRKEPDRRYHSVRQFASDIQNCFDQRPVVARRDSFAYRFGKLIRRNRVNASLAAALMVAVFAGVFGIAWQWNRHRDEKFQREMLEMRQHDQQMARNTIPTIQRLVADRKWFDAFQLANVALTHLGDHSTAQELLNRLSQKVAIETIPPGAEVRLRPVYQPDRDWLSVGRTRLERRLPRGMLHWHISKPGYDELVVLRSVGWKTEPMTFQLARPSELPPDMLRVPDLQKVRIQGVGDVECELGAYLIDQFEVTNRKFFQFVDQGGYENRNHWKHEFREDGKAIAWHDAVDRFRDQTGQFGPSTWVSAKYRDGEEDYPVRGISWYEAAAYAHFVGKSLPTICHWHGAAAMYDQPASIVPYSNINNRSPGPAPVGRYQGIGPYGTLDMAGNVKEWCWNGAGVGLRYILGGSWHEPDFMFSEPDVHSPWRRADDFGFRCITTESSEKFPPELFDELPYYQRDYTNASACSDEEFEIYRKYFEYDDKELNERQLGTKRFGDIIRETWVFDPAYASDDQVIARLYLPDPKRHSPPYQTVVYFPGSYAIDSPSSDENHVSGQFRFLLEGGRALLFPVYWGTYERNNGRLRSGYPEPTKNYRDAVINISNDLGRSIDFLQNRDDIDSDRLAYYGYSWGAARPMLLAVEPRLKAAVLHCGGLVHTTAYEAVDQINFVSRIYVPVLMLNGQYDAVFPVERSQKPMFERISVPDGEKRHKVFDVGHYVPTSTLVSETENWLNRFLGPVK